MEFYMMKLLLLLLLVSCGKPIVEEKKSLQGSHSELLGIDEELLLETKMSMNFDLLPLDGRVERNGKFWSGDSWPLKQGAINYRWNAIDKTGWNYQSPTRREAGVWPLEMLKKLSPSEKYDLWQGRYDYPLRWEVDTLARLGTLDWEGLCHGFAGATINHPEPLAKVVTNPDGIKIPFGTSDIKALLTYAYSKILIREESQSLGRHCDEKAHAECADLSAMSFHIVLANKLGLRGQSVIADMDRSSEVWNHPIVAFESRPKQFQTMPYGRRAVIETKITYVDVVKKNSWERHNPVYGYLTVNYELAINQKGNIFEGKWLSKDRPDFLWTIDKAERFEGYLSDINELAR